jgi:hypothetical protein
MQGLYEFYSAQTLLPDYSQSLEVVFTRYTAWLLLFEQCGELFTPYTLLVRETGASWALGFEKQRELTLLAGID